MLPSRRHLHLAEHETVPSSAEESMAELRELATGAGGESHW